MTAFTLRWPADALRRGARMGAMLLAVAGSAGAAAQSVSLQGTMGTRALLMVDGTPRTLAAGESHGDIKLLSVGAGEALVEQAGRRLSLRVGEAPASVGAGAAPSRGSRIVLSATTGGHFTTLGAINGRAANFMVDTGASVMALGVAEAERVGLNFRAGRPVQVHTANGSASGWSVKLASVRIGDVEVHEVDAIVVPQAMPFVLLGNSYLMRFQMKRDNDQLVLDRRY